MAKKSRKQRKKERETKNFNNVPKNAYTHHIRRTCNHYYWCVEGNYFNSYLVEAADGTYKCKDCMKNFTKEQASQLDTLGEYLTSANSKNANDITKLLTPEIMPNEYYYTAQDETVICETVEEDANELVEYYKKNRMITKSEACNRLDTLIQKAMEQKITIKNSEEIFGEPYTLYSEDILYPTTYCSYDYYPYYLTEELADLLKNSKNADDAYRKLGKILSLSNLSPGYIKRCDDIFANRIQNLIDKYQEDLKKAANEWAENQEFSKSAIYNDPRIRNEERQHSSDLLPQYENIFFREDLFEYLLQEGVANNLAYALMQNISEEKQRPIFFERFTPGPELINKEFSDWAEKVRYLPSRKLIWDIFDVKERQSNE